MKTIILWMLILCSTTTWAIWDNEKGNGGNVLTPILKKKLEARWKIIRSGIKYNYFFMNPEVINNVARYQKVLERPVEEVVFTTRKNLQAFDNELQKMRNADALSFPETQTIIINEYSLSSILSIGDKCALDRLLFHEISSMIELEDSFDFSITDESISYICGIEKMSLVKGLMIINYFYTPNKVNFRKVADELAISEYDAKVFSVWAGSVIRNKKTLIKSLLEQESGKCFSFYIKPGKNCPIKEAFCDTEFVESYAKEMGFFHLINFSEICK